jgi:hypothetical protein
MKKILLAITFFISICANAQNIHLNPIRESFAPPVDIGNMWWNISSVVHPPNSNNAFTWLSGLFIYGNNSAFIPMSTENILNSTLRAMGDNWISNQGLSSSANGAINKIANFRGWGINNGAINGYKVSDINWNNATTSNGATNILAVGINDMRTYGYAGLTNYLPCIMNAVVYAQAGTVINAQNGSPTTPANWSPYTITAYGNSTIARLTTTNNSPLKFNLPGKTVYVSVMDSTTSTVTYNITIDGTVMGTYTAINSYGVNSMGDCKRFSGLGDSMHVVSIQRTGGTGALVVNWAASNFAPIQATGASGNRYYVTSVGRMTAGNGSSGYVNFGGSDTAVESYNKYLKALIYQLSSDGLQTGFIDYNKYYDPKVTGFAQSDSLNPADPGQTNIATQLLNVTSTYVQPRDRDAIRIVQDNITLDGLSGAAFKNGSGTYTPSVVNSVNASGTLTGNVSHWYRVADQIIVDGSFTCSSVSSANTATFVLLSLPVATNITATTDLEGFDVLAGGTVSITGFCAGDATTDKASIEWYPTATATATIHFHFTYTLQQ